MGAFGAFQISRRFGAQIAWEMFADVFKRRLDTGEFKASRALEQNFENPTTDIERHIKADIDVFRKKNETKWEQEVFTQKRRLADANPGST